MTNINEAIDIVFYKPPSKDRVINKLICNAAACGGTIKYNRPGSIIESLSYLERKVLKTVTAKDFNHRIDAIYALIQEKNKMRHLRSKGYIP